ERSRRKPQLADVAGTKTRATGIIYEQASANAGVRTACSAGPRGEIGKKAPDAEKLPGTWAFISIEVNGMKLPEKALRASNIGIKGDAFTTRSPGAIYKGTITLDAMKAPKTIDLYFAEGPEKGNTSLGVGFLILIAIMGAK